MRELSRQVWHRRRSKTRPTAMRQWSRGINKETPALSGERRPGDAISGGADFIVPESCIFVKRYF